ncbi:MAG: efflux RND transporter permease subunit [Candidatus Cryptobacteroides sp.]|nr:efflux RND transporter permease subunit [Rikenellaceae bacterium]MDY5747046.1 efflux RND transporter permease subunit [Candidatus Cryptobacteroides sp.]
MNWLNGIIHFSLKNRLLVLLGAALIVAGGLWSADRIDVDVFPDLTAPTVVIMSDARGMSAEEVERLVTFPVETAVNGAANVRRVRSSSMYGYSFVWVEFDWGMDVFRARQTVSEKLVTIGEQLPEGIVPMLAPQSSVMGEIMFIGMQSDSTSMMELRDIADWVIKPAILATGGVSQVTVVGGDEKQYQVLADPLRMEAFGVTMAELEDACTSLSVNSEGGIIRDRGNEYALRGIARTTDLNELGATLVRTSGSDPVCIRDIATIRTGAAVRLGTASMNAKPAVIISVSKQPDINTLKVTRAIERSVQDAAAALPSDITVDTHIFQQADFIQASVGNVGRALLEGALFVILILFLFLGNFRTTLISVIAIPVSLLATIIVLLALGMDINTMTLGGMCIAIGSLVDDAIIDVENVYKRLRQNHRKAPSDRDSVFNVVFEGSREIRSSVINATLIIMVAFTPLFFLDGMEGRLLKPLGISFIIALFMSLLVAMTLTPLLCKDLLASEKYLDKNDRESFLSRKLSAWYARALDTAMSHKKAVLGATALLLAGAVVVFSFMGSSFLPDFNEGSMTISAVTGQGSSLDVSDQLGELMERELLTIPEVVRTSRRTGRGDLDEHSQATNGAEIDVNFKLGKRPKDEVFDEVRAKLNAIPGVAVTVGQPLGHRIDHMLSGTKAAIAIKIFGPDLSTLQMTGNSIKAAIADIEGLVDLSIEQQASTPQILIKAKREALAAYGISTGEFNRFVELAFSGEKMSDIYEGQRRYDVVLKLDDKYTENADAIGKVLIDTGFGGKVPLEQVAEIVSTTGPGAISRENVQRKLVVSANVSGRDVGSVVEDIRETVSRSITLPEGYRIEYGGQFESAGKASRTLALATILAVFVIFLLLYAEFHDLGLSLIVLASLPLALIGGVFAVWISSAVISIPAIIGFITLFGIATRNGVLLINRYRHLQASGTSLQQSIREGSVDRLNPILMTALTSALALIPLVVNGDKTGNEIQSPMAVVVLGGLVSSTLLNIFVVPIMYEWFEKRKTRKCIKS